jgi:hypothetical protein
MVMASDPRAKGQALELAHYMRSHPLRGAAVRAHAAAARRHANKPLESPDVTLCATQ